MGTHRGSGRVVKMVHSGPSPGSQKLETVKRKNESHIKKEHLIRRHKFKIENSTQKEADEEPV
jgi:hypothetical protein